jgi:mRNA interferase RelE/StbE
MAAYSISFKESARNDFEGIPAADLRRIMKRIASLAQAPRGHGCEKLSGQDKYRILQGKWRILYSIQDKQLTVCVVKVGHRREVCRA